MGEDKVVDNLLELVEADVVDFTEAFVDVVLVLIVLSLDTFLILVLFYFNFT